MATEGKSKIIEAAKQVISKNGITGATMRGIAEEAGLSTGAIYHYYKSKEEILYDVMDESLSVSTQIAAESRLAGINRDDLIEKISESVQARFKKTDENRLQFYLAQEAMLGNDELKGRFKDKYREWISRTEELLGALYGDKASKQDKAFAAILIGAIDGVAMQLLLGANQSEVDEIAEVYHEILKEGIPRFREHLSKNNERAQK